LFCIFCRLCLHLKYLNVSKWNEMRNFRNFTIKNLYYLHLSFAEKYLRNFGRESNLQKQTIKVKPTFLFPVVHILHFCCCCPYFTFLLLLLLSNVVELILPQFSFVSFRLICLHAHWFALLENVERMTISLA